MVTELKVCILGRFLRELVYYFVNIFEAVKQHELTNISQRVVTDGTNRGSSPHKKDEVMEALDVGSDGSSDSSYSDTEGESSVFNRNMNPSTSNNVRTTSAGNAHRAESDNINSPTGGGDAEDEADKKKNKNKTPPLKFLVIVKKLEIILPRNTASIEATALTIEEVVLKNKVIEVNIIICTFCSCSFSSTQCKIIIFVIKRIRIYISCYRIRFFTTRINT
jgi:hypothetical protein